jgi:dihydrofolate reductase
MPTFNAIAAVANNGVIGARGGIPWHEPADMRHFKALTLGSSVIMGRKTFESLGHLPLKDRTNYVVSSSADLDWPKQDNLVWLDSSVLKNPSLMPSGWIIGGAQLYETMLPYCRHLWLTRVECEPEGSVFFPRISEHWKLASSQKLSPTATLEIWWNSRIKAFSVPE